MSSETITRNDLTGILNEVLPIPQGTYYDLVWQNPNGIGSMTALMSGETAVTLTKSINSFDGFLCEFRCYYNTGQKTYGHYFTGASGMYAQTTVIRDVGNPMMEFSRTWWASGDMTITFSDCTRIVSNGSNVVGQDTGCLVPLRIWGIKLKTVGVSPMQEDYIVGQGTDGIWTYRKWNNGSYDAVYVGTVNMQAGSAMGGGYFHQTSSALTPPSFSQTVKSLHGAANSAVLFSYVGHANDYSTYWWNASSTAVSNVSVRLEMHGTWK